MSGRPIGDYALLSDCQGAALVARDGAVEWLCWPRFDAPSTFARLLDPAGGHWSLGPVGGARTRREYVSQTMVLRTEHRTGEGTLVVTDALATGAGERGHGLGHASPHVLLRRAECTEGAVEVATELAPRPDYGRAVPRVEARDDGGVAFLAAAEASVVSSSLALTAGGDGVARGRRRLHAGEDLCFALELAARGSPLPAPWSARRIATRLADTIETWRSWSAIHQAYEGPYAELVHMSGRVLQALTYAPNGGIVAAPTTSLPEAVGAGRNWDYRYVWSRDAGLTLGALWVAACPDEAEHFFGWLAGPFAEAAERGEDPPVLLAAAGGPVPREEELTHLAGWRDSRPVRVGNDADGQLQLDAYGELLLAAAILREQLGEEGTGTRELLIALTDAAAERWSEPDSGIWEIRGERRDYLHSKLMCWAALDRAVALGEEGFLSPGGDRLGRWREAREEVHAAILERGWSQRAGAFAQAFDADDLDASALMVAILGFLPHDDPRLRTTVDAVERHLTDGRGLVHRYLVDDGMEGEEGSFVLCSFWLAEALARIGEPERARVVFERVAGHANDLGLMAEQVDPADGAQLGNFPQAFSHVGLVNAAWAIACAEGAPGAVGGGRRA